MRPLRPAESRALALLLALLALALVYLVAVHWWFVAPQLRIAGEMRDLREQQARYAGIIAQRDAVQARLNAMQRGQREDRAFLPEADPNAAAAALMQRAMDAVQRHAGEGLGCDMPQKMPVSRDHGDEPYRRVSVSITLRCGTQPLTGILYDLEAGMPYLFVDELSAYRPPVASGSDAVPARLEVQFVLSGYIRQPAAAEASP